MDPFIGEIRIFSGNFAPANWALCNGQQLAIQQYTALFSLLGTAYGGNGTTNFALPNLQGRLPMGAGQGPGLTLRTIGDAPGEVGHILSTEEMPAHNHTIAAASASGTSGVAKGNFPASSVSDRATGIATDTPYDPTKDTTMNPALILATGGGAGGIAAAHSNMQPYLGINYIISLAGVFPPRQ